MSRTVIVANGELRHLDSARALLREGDRLIAADGGARHCRALGLTPQVVIGDLDSLTEADLASLESDGARIVRHPARKDQTDLELALDWAVTQGAGQIVVLGALGGRWDQTLANLLLLFHTSGAEVRLIEGSQEVVALRGPGRLTLAGRPGDTVSLIPVGGDAHGVTTVGLEYPLANGALRFGSTLGVSNILVGSSATVELRDGRLICVHISANNEKDNSS